MKKVIAGINESGQRLDKFLIKYLSGAGSGFVYKMLRKKNITLNGKKSDGHEKLVQGDEITFWLSDETIEKFRVKKDLSYLQTLADPEIIYEDENILVMNKPVGLLSQKAEEKDISINEMMLSYLLRSGSISEEQMRSFRPSVCNRLDRNTSGLITAGKTLAGTQFLSEGMRDRSFHKYYFTVVSGRIEEAQTLKGYLVKDEKTNKVRLCHSSSHHADYIETRYTPISSHGNLTLLKVLLVTGRTHQIRAHLSDSGHPIIGDYKYGNPETNNYFKARYKLKHQLLHAGLLEMPELEGTFSALSKKRFEAPLPAQFRRILDEEGLSSLLSKGGM